GVNRGSKITEPVKQRPLMFPGCKAGIQAKLRINHPDDAFEREADRVSEQVTNSPGRPTVAKLGPISRLDVAQRACACGGTCAHCQDNFKKDEHLQRKSPPDHAANDSVPPIVDEALRSPGQPLDAETRTSMEQRFGYDFSRVRIHTDPLAERSARAIQA